MASLPRCSSRVAKLTQDVWSVFSPLAVQSGAVNLGQGFPNYPPPEFIIQAANKAIAQDANNQYAPPKGASILRTQLSQTYSPLFNRALNPDTNILITAGANHAIYATLAAYLNQGDETIIIEPGFDQYESNILMNGGVPVYVPLRPPPTSTTGRGMDVSANCWTLDLNELRSKLTMGKSKILILNTPHNPTGKVFSKDELLQIGQVAKEYNLLIIADEVYEHLIYKGSPLNTHTRLSTLSDDLWQRTITIGSVGKSFSVTGWRVGWAIGSSRLIDPVLRAHTRTVFCTNHPFQVAAASAFQYTQLNNDYFSKHSEFMQSQRDKLVRCFQHLGVLCYIPQGSFFILVRFSNVHVPDHELDSCVPKSITSPDWRLCYWLTTRIGVAAIPCSAFYCPDHAHLGAQYLRFCFCKTDQTLDVAISALQSLKPYIKPMDLESCS